jgi:hypothetical protein
LIENFRVFTDEEGDHAVFFDEISRLHLAEPEAPLCSGCTAPSVVEASTAVLIPWHGASRPVDRFKIWSQRPVAKSPSGVYYVYVEFYTLMGVRPCELEEVMSHLIFIAQLVDTQPAQLARLGYELQPMLDETYTFIAGFVESASDQIRERLSMCRCLLLNKYVTSRTTFVSGTDIFYNLEKDFPPFAYNWMNLTAASRKNGSLLSLLGVEDHPTCDTVIKWMQSLAGADHIIPAERLDTAVSLLELLSQEDLQGRPQLSVPDQQGRLTNIRELYVDDAPWLEHRIHQESIRLAPAGLQSKTARRLGIALLSKAVEEELEPGYIVVLSTDERMNSQLAQWEQLITSALT